MDTGSLFEHVKVPAEAGKEEETVIETPEQFHEAILDHKRHPEAEEWLKTIKAKPDLGGLKSDQISWCERRLFQEANEAQDWDRAERVAKTSIHPNNVEPRLARIREKKEKAERKQ